jgi:excisionase family DNA binding protein
MDTNKGKLLSPREVAEYVNVPLATLYGWQSKGTGPKFFKVGKHVRYRQAQVDKWLDEHMPDGAGR